MISGRAGGYAIDELAFYDMPAIITNVREITGKKPLWVGHSMGGTKAYMYLQGARFTDLTNLDSTVVSDPALMGERNAETCPKPLRLWWTWTDLSSPWAASHSSCSPSGYSLLIVTVRRSGGHHWQLRFPDGWTYRYAASPSLWRVRPAGVDSQFWIFLTLRW